MPVKSKLEPFKDEVLHLYVTEKKSCTNIGERFNLCPNVVREFLIKNNIKIRSTGLYKGMTSWNKGKTFPDKSYEKFNNGLLTNRRMIYRHIVKRDGNKCCTCAITEWNNKPIRLWVDHIDGNASNNTPSNFRLICPNCDSQSQTFGGKNRGSGRKSRGMKSYS